MGRRSPMYTILNHFGTMMLATVDMIIIAGFCGWEKWSKYPWFFWTLAIIGALAIVYMDFGLGICP